MRPRDTSLVDDPTYEERDGYGWTYSDEDDLDREVIDADPVGWC